MRTLHLRRLAVLLGVAVALLIGVYFLHGAQVRRHARFFLAQSDILFGEERYEDAIEHLNRYVKLAPEDFDALEELGRQLDEINAKVDAFNVFERLLRNDPGRADARRKVAQLAIDMRSYPDA